MRHKKSSGAREFFYFYVFLHFVDLLRIHSVISYFVYKVTCDKNRNNFLRFSKKTKTTWTTSMFVFFYKSIFSEKIVSLILQLILNYCLCCFSQTSKMVKQEIFHFLKCWNSQNQTRRWTTHTSWVCVVGVGTLFDDVRVSICV